MNGQIAFCKISIGFLLALMASQSTAKTLIDYFLPIPVTSPLVSNIWGAPGVLPRDQNNGIEDKAATSWSYWDGRIQKDNSGKFHMYVSRWSQGAGHNGWFGSSCVHTVSDSVRGPYVDKGLCYSDASGQGHNVMGSQLNDGRYFILVSETRRPATVYTSTSLDGPWNKEGTLTFDANGFNVDVASGSDLHSNTTLWVRPDGSILCTGRHGIIALSTTGILGPYKVQGTSVYPNIDGRENTGVFAEDPVLWYSGGLYHMIYNYPDDRYAYHLTSVDGIHNWTNRGIAFDPRQDFVRYTDGTVNHWYKMERPQVYLENGHVTHFTFAVIDVEKSQDVGNDNHDSKVIVVPFDGVQFDIDNAPPVPVPAHRDSVFNGGFDQGTNGWTFNTWGSTAQGSVVNGEYHIAITALGNGNASVQLVQNGIILQQGKSYEVKFDAYASASRTLEANVEQDVSPWTSYLPALESFDLTTKKTTYSYTFTMTNATDSNGRVSFNAGASTTSLTLDNISIKEVAAPVAVHAQASKIAGAMRWRNGTLFFTGVQAGTLQIIDSRGRSRLVELVGGQASTGLLPAGLYHVRLLGENSTSIKSIVVVP